MAIGDITDMTNRLRSYIPPWFDDNITLRDAWIQSFAYCASFVYSLLIYSKKQTRIKTATDGFLDLIAKDFFGNRIKRQPNQTDDSFRNVILAVLLHERGTRNGMNTALTQLTGNEPIIFEPRRDGGAYNQDYYNQYLYGSQSYPFQAFITVFRPVSSLKNNQGYYDQDFYYDQSYYGTSSDVSSLITDQDIYAVINAVKPIATRMWVDISN